jgi:hypothetical protein
VDALSKNPQISGCLFDQFIGEQIAPKLVPRAATNIDGPLWYGRIQVVVATL